MLFYIAIQKGKVEKAIVTSISFSAAVGVAARGVVGSSSLPADDRPLSGGDSRCL